MKTLISSFLLLIATTLTVAAQTVVAAHGIRARSIIIADDLVTLDQVTIGAITSISDVIGLEARVNLYAGRAIRASDIGTPAILERNQLVIMIFKTGLLSISAEGRVLDRAGVGDLVRVMNLDSRLTVTGRVMQNGTIEVRS